MQKRVVVALMFIIFPVTGRSLLVVTKTLPVFGEGPVNFTCLEMDNGVVPLHLPANTQIIRNSNSISILWPTGQGSVTIATASPAESGLLDKAGKTAKRSAWEKVVWSQIDNSVENKAVRDFQIEFLSVNQWKMSALAVDYSLGSIAWTNSLTVLRCKNGESIAIHLSAPQTDFEGLRSQLYQMLGSSMLLKN